MVVGEVCAGHPQAGVCDERAERSNHELALGSSPEGFEGTVELLPAAGQGAHSFFRDWHVWFERPRRDTGVVIVVDADTVLFLDGAVGV